MTDFLSSVECLHPSARGARLVSRVGLIVLAGAILALASPNAASAESLEETLAAAYLTNPSLVAQRIRLREIDEGVNRAISSARPTVEFMASAGSVHDGGSASRSSSSRNPASFGLGASQPLLRGGRTHIKVRAAENSVLAERARLVSREQSVLLAAATAYLDVFRDQAVLQLTTNNENVLARQLEAAQDRFQVGEITRTDVYQAEARLAQATAGRIQSEANLEASRATYQAVTGLAQTASFDLPANPPDMPPSKDVAIQEAISNNPLVVSAQYDEQVAVDNVDDIRGELMPELDLNLGVSRDFNTQGGAGSASNARAVLNLTVPLYRSGAVQSRVRAAKQAALRLGQIVDQERRAVSERATRAWQSLQAADARVTSFQTQIQAATIALDGVEREAAVGSRTLLDVLNAEQELLNARVNHITAQRDAGVAMFDMLNAVGRLTAHHLRLPVDLYDPDIHYHEVRGKWYGLGTRSHTKP